MNQTETIDYKHGTTYAITVTALMTAVTCILAPLSIPIGPVPISLTNLAIYISLYLLGWKRGTISYLIYLLIGLVGIPVFSGFTGGPAKLAGPTGGYIIGFIAMAIIAGLVIDHFHQPWLQLIGMIVGTIICYVLGTAWFCFEAKSTVSGALSICVLPFIPGDLSSTKVSLASRCPAGWFHNALPLIVSSTTKNLPSACTTQATVTCGLNILRP